MKKHDSFALRFGIVMLMIFVWAMPLLATSFPTPNGFRSTSPYKIENSGTDAKYQGNKNFGNKTYTSTIYDPFGNQTPSSGGGGNPANGDGNSDGNSDGGGEDVGIPGWADTPSEPLPIADGTLFLLLIATIMITTIALKQHKQKQLQSITTNNNNNPAQHMTTRKQTYQSLLQKLFLLLAFVSIFAGQANADRTIYFRPSTVSITGGNGYDASSWYHYSDVGTSAYIMESYKTEWANDYYSVTTNRDYRPQLTRHDHFTSSSTFPYIQYTLPDDYTRIAVYRWKSTSYQFGDYKNTRKPERIVYSIPKGGEGKFPDSAPLEVPDGVAYGGAPATLNLLVAQEGKINSSDYYWAHLTPANSTIEIYFADINKWSTATEDPIQLLTGKDIFTRCTSLERIPETRLWYKTFATEDRAFAYKFFGFVHNTKPWWNGDINIHSTRPHTVSSATAEGNKIATQIAKATTSTTLLQDTPLGVDATSGISLFTPGSENKNSTLNKETITNWKTLNHTQTVIVEKGGNLNYQTFKLASANSTTKVHNTDQTGTVKLDAAYTATVILRAKPDDGYYFLGFFDEATGELLTRGEKMTDALGGYVYRYQAPNAPKTIRARFTPIKQVRIQYPTNASWTAWDTESIGNILKINYTGLTGNPVEFTFDKYPTENISEDVYITDDDSFKIIYIKNIDIDLPLTLTAIEDNDHTFIGWRYDTVRFADNPWTVSDKSGKAFTARFVKFLQHTINVQTYNKEQNKYVLSEDGGSVEITYNKLDHTNVGDFERKYKTNVRLRDTYSIPSNTSVTLTATPKDGYSFVGWYEGQNLVSKELEYTYTAETARNITAYFAKGTETTTLDVRAMIHKGTALEESLTGGTFTMTHSGGIVYKHNTVGYVKNIPVSIEPVTFFATPNDGYEFIGWFNNDNGQHPDNPWIMQDPSDTDKNGKYDKSVTAVFASPDSVVKQDIKIEGPGTVTANYLLYPKKDNQNRTFNHNFSFNAWKGEHDITLTAEPLAGYEFVGWYDAEDNLIIDGNKLTYTADVARTITAKFKSAINKLTVSILNYNTSYNEFREYEYEYNKVALTGGGKSLESYSSFSCEFKDATSVTLTATPESDEETGYDFIGWYQNNTLLSKEATISVNVIGMQAISAYFAPKKCWKVTINHNAGGLFTVLYSRDRNFNNTRSAESALDHETYTHFAFDTTYIKIAPRPILGYKYLGFKVGGSYPSKDHPDIYIYQRNPKDNTGNYIQNFNTSITTNFVREDDQVVYLNLLNAEGQPGWSVRTHDAYAYYAYAYNNFRTNDIKQKWIRMEQVQDYLYRCTIPGNIYNRINFVQICMDKEGNFVTTDKTKTVDIELDNDTTLSLTYVRDSLQIQNTRSVFLTIPATRYNCYRIKGEYTSDTGDGQPGYIDGWTTPPTQEGDFRLVYIEQTVEDNTIREDYRFDKAEAIKRRTSAGTDTLSLHIYNKVSDGIDYMNNPEVILQRCTGRVDGISQWVEVERRMVFGPLRAINDGVIRMPGRRNAGATINYDNGIDAIKNDKDNGSGVWNFVISQDGNGNATILADETHRYTGNYYIRTTNADGQYNTYTHPNNVMKLSEYAADNSDYSHYFIRYVDINEDGTPTAEAGKHPLVKFAIANDYAVYLNHELMINNDRFSEDEYENDIFVINDNNNPKLPADATVRFGWDSVTNRLTRAYIANTTIKNNEYLVVEEGENIGAPQGDAQYFTDNSNWLYSIDLPDAKAGATAKVKAKMNGQYQYFMGAQPDSQNEFETLISGNGTNTYPIRLLYDFKDDRFTTIYHPESGTITDDVALSTPLMIEREHNDKATQIQLETNKKITTVQAGEDQYTQPAYAVMTFLESVLTDASKTHHEKMFYWISFPFDVRIKDVFGLGDYGKYWIMEEYNGAQRAASGLAQNNWKYITNKSDTLKANKGYVLCLNYSQILQDKLFKSYGGSDKTLNSGKLSLYFPSNSVINPSAITGGQTRTVDLARYDNTTTGSNTAWNHHNWHIIGVPSFANPERVDFQNDAPFVYQYWHPTDGYAAVSINDVEFQAMHAYMVQYHGPINWQSIVNTGDGNVTPMGLAAKTDEQADKKVMLRLELQQASSTLDKTYVQLRNDKGTKGFDMSLDLTKIINAGANIYSVVSGDQMAGNAIPKEETVLPIGVVITDAGEYTFAMPNGTESMLVELIDYEQGTATNLLMSDYTIHLPKGTFDQRFALRLVPDKVATSVENIGEAGNGSDGETVRKLLIDGVLYLQKGNHLYNAQGHSL